QDQDQKKLLPQRPFLPRHRHQLADLVDRPGPDDFDEAENRRNTLMQEFQELIENLFHGQNPEARPHFASTSSLNAKGSVGFPTSGERAQSFGDELHLATSCI